MRANLFKKRYKESPCRENSCDFYDMRMISHCVFSSKRFCIKIDADKIKEEYDEKYNCHKKDCKHYREDCYNNCHAFVGLIAIKNKNCGSYEWAVEPKFKIGDLVKSNQSSFLFRIENIEIRNKRYYYKVTRALFSHEKIISYGEYVIVEENLQIHFLESYKEENNNTIKDVESKLNNIELSNLESKLKESRFNYLELD